MPNNQQPQLQLCGIQPPPLAASSNHHHHHHHQQQQRRHLPPFLLPTTTTLPTPATTVPKSTPTSTTIANSCKKANGRNAGPNDDCVVWALCKFFFHLFLVFINLLICVFCFLDSNLLVTTDRCETTQTHRCLRQPPPPHQNRM
jgi:hypothetical protein